MQKLLVHDDPAQMRRCFPEHAHLAQGGGTHIDFAVDLGGLRQVALDTSVPWAPYGELDHGHLAFVGEFDGPHAVPRRDGLID